MLRAILIAGLSAMHFGIVMSIGLAGETSFEESVVFPGKSWEQRTPEQLALNGSILDELSLKLGGRGCVIRNGFVVRSWGDQAEVSDWFSSAKPVLSTLLFFAIEEGLAKDVDQPIADFGWKLSEKDRAMTFRHLGAMTSGYARPEKPGAAWSYNDFAIQLYQKTLFDKVFREDAKVAAEHPARLGALQFEDGLTFSKKRRLSASVRDFARIVWFWNNRGSWDGKQVLPQRYFDEYMQPQVPSDLPATMLSETADYLGIESYGGGSDHFAKCGPGIYGFNWWFNKSGRQHPETLTWPDAPADTVMSIGSVSFRQGPDIATSPASDEGVATAFDGQTGSFRVREADSTAPGFYRKGLLRYCVYLFGGQSTTLDVPEGTYSVSWFNPWIGGKLSPGVTLTGPGKHSIGGPPANPDKDWVAVIRLDGGHGTDKR